MLLSRDAITAAVEARVDAADFYKPAHGHIFDAVWSLYEQGEPVDPVTVAEELRRAGLLEALGGKGALLQIQAATPASANAGALRQDRQRARAAAPAHHGVGRDRRDRATTSPTTSPRRSTAPRRWSSTSPRSGSPSRWCSVFDSVTETVDQLEHCTATSDTLTGVADRATPTSTTSCSGSSRRTSIVVAARPGMGKTASRSAPRRTSRWRAAGRSLFFSMEMGTVELTKRMLAAEARVDARKLQTGKLTDGDWSRLNTAISHLGEAPLFIDDNPHCTVMEMRAKARRIKARHGDLGARSSSTTSS